MIKYKIFCIYSVFLSSEENKKISLLDEIKINYINSNKNDYFKYGKYVFFIIITIYIIRNYLKKLFFQKIIFKKELQEKLILRNYLVKDIANSLNNEDKFKFLSKCSLDPKSIYKDKNNNYRFILDFPKIDETLKDKIGRLDTFKENSFKNNNTIHGSYNFNESKAKTIYEVECFNSGEYMNINEYTSNKCSIISMKHGFIHYFLKLKNLKNSELLNNFEKSLSLFNGFLDIFDDKLIENSSIKHNFNKLIKNNNLNDWMTPEKISLDEYFIKESIKKLENQQKIENLTSVYKEENTEVLINLIFDKLINIINNLQEIGNYFLTIKSIKYFFQVFNYSISKIDDKYLLPNIFVKLPIIDSMITLNPFFEIEIQADLSFNHLQYHFYSLDKEEVLEFKEFIEYWIEKYEKSNKNFLKIYFKTYNF